MVPRRLCEVSLMVKSEGGSQELANYVRVSWEGLPHPFARGDPMLGIGKAALSGAWQWRN